MDIPFISDGSSCCCSNACSSFSIESDEDTIAEIKDDPNQKYRTTVSCEVFKKSTLKAKIVGKGTVKCSGFESASYKSGDKVVRLSNTISGSGKTVAGLPEAPQDCACIPNVVSVGVDGTVKARYVERVTGEPPSVYTQTGGLGIGVGSIHFLCKKGSESVDIYSGFAVGVNVSENPDNKVSINGLKSSGSLTVDFFGTSVTIKLPYNTWSPAWAVYSNYKAAFSLTGSVSLSLQPCEDQ